MRLARASRLLALLVLASCDADEIDRTALRISAFAGCTFANRNIVHSDFGASVPAVPVVAPTGPLLLTVENLLDDPAIITSLAAKIECDANGFSGNSAPTHPWCRSPRIEPTSIAIGARESVIVRFALFQAEEFSESALVRVRLEIEGRSGERVIATGESEPIVVVLCPTCCPR
jgi:hypothetical protein